MEGKRERGRGRGVRGKKREDFSELTYAGGWSETGMGCRNGAQSASCRASQESFNNVNVCVCMCVCVCVCMRDNS